MCLLVVQVENIAKVLLRKASHIEVRSWCSLELQMIIEFGVFTGICIEFAFVFLPELRRGDRDGTVVLLVVLLLIRHVLIHPTQVAEWVHCGSCNHILSLQLPCLV